MFRVKICGITSVVDAEAVAAGGGDAIGLNFYRQSPRFVTRAVAEEVAARMARRVCRVGLFVNSPAAEVCRTFDDLRLDLIQLHGDEPPEYLAELGCRPAMKALRVTGSDVGYVTTYVDECHRLGCRPAAVLLDAYRPGQFGGTGTTVDWAAIRSLKERLVEIPLVLAGGLGPENVAEAIRAAQPDAVDVASGVESAPGVKDPAKVVALVQAALAAFPGAYTEK
jgi:phosphoribosylanthranilate isomerase